MKGLFATDSWHASDGRFEGSIGSPPSLDQGFVLLKKYKSIYQPAEAEENEEGSGRFLLLIHEFMVTSFMKTFRCKHYLPYIMTDLDVSQKSAQLVELCRKQSESSSETLSATQLIIEMGKPSLETDFKLGPQPCSVNISLLQHKANGDSPEFVPSTVMPHLEQDDIEEKSSSWSTSPVMCTLSSVDQTSFDRQSEITNFLYPTPCYRGYGIQGHQGSASLLNPRPLKNRQKRIKIKHTNVTDRLLFLPHIPIKHFSVHGSQCNNKAKKCQQDVCDLKPECGTTVPSEDKTQKSTTMQGSHCQQARHKPDSIKLGRSEWECTAPFLRTKTFGVEGTAAAECHTSCWSLDEWKDDYHVSSAQEDCVASSGHHHLCEDSSCSPMQLFTEISTLKTSSRSSQAQNCSSTDTDMPAQKHKDWSKDQISVCKSVEAWHDSSVTNAKISEKEAIDSEISFVCSSEMDISYNFPQEDLLVDCHAARNKVTQGMGESNASSENKLVYTVLKECHSEDTALSSSSKDHPYESSRQGRHKEDVTTRFSDSSGITASYTADFHQNQLF
ncbi:uncharacterized protein LOC112576634 [Pomacea canaliculata]|uniref:uncharacterized protein LOC112576634 n=1 Tax=Pomacea canaliculata TaxID=400727 RepID=UPI000D7396FF|nr:uncharacterized protein LOC112576634 [Pomacea canaliculata]